VIGRGALTADGSAPDLSRVRDGLQACWSSSRPSEALEQRLGFRVRGVRLAKGVAERVPDHPALAGLDDPASARLARRGDADLPPRLEYEPSDALQRLADRAVVRTGGPEAVALRQPRQRRVGARSKSRLAATSCRSSTAASALQYSPLLEFREGRGMVLFCQLDVTRPDRFRTGCRPIGPEPAGLRGRRGSPRRASPGAVRGRSRRDAPGSSTPGMPTEQLRRRTN
jgi:beta-galactosidase